MLMTTTTLDKNVEVTETRAWSCKRCHAVIGQVTIINHVHRLEIPDRGIVLTGSAEVQCLKCGQVRVWVAAEEGMEHLLERMKARR